MTPNAPPMTPDALLLTTIYDVLSRKAENARLREALEEAAPGIDVMESDFISACDSIPPRVRPGVQTQIESAQGFFEQIRIAVVWVRDYLEFGELELLHNAADTIARCRFHLDALTRSLKNRVWAIQGPTEIPNLNALFWAYDFYRKDSNKHAALRELADAERKAMPAAIRAVDQGPETLTAAALKQAFEAHAAQATHLIETLDAGRSREMGKAFEALRDSFYRLKSLIPQASESQRAAGETRSAQVNVVLGLTDDLLAQKIQDIVLMRALDVLRETLEGAQSYFLSLRKDPSDSPLLNAEIASARAELAQQDAALVDYSTFFETREVACLKRAKETLAEATRKLWISYDAITSLADREGKTMCFRCSHYNSSDRARCEKCGTLLPKAVLEDSGGISSTFITGEDGAPEKEATNEGPVLTTNMVRLYSAVDRMMKGNSSTDNFLAELSWFEGLLDENAQDEPELEAAVTKMREGIAVLRAFPDTRNPTDLEDGVRLCNEGARKLVTLRDKK